MTIMIGIDPHKATHTAVAVDDNEVVLDELRLRASSVQAQRLCEWTGGFEQPRDPSAERPLRPRRSATTPPGEVVIDQTGRIAVAGVVPPSFG